ncbi:MAG: DUF494 domain-containing protein [Rhodocyclaceae bacterium]|nr:DUF494 domain-containing protein [Rhodocyclaceae bacterium]
MIDVLVFLFENYFDLNAHPAPGTLVRKLSAAGFDPDEISLALDWLDDLKSARPLPFVADPRAVRVHTAEEHDRLGADGLDFILFLEGAGVVTPPLRELIIERALGMDDEPVPLDKLKIIVLMVLWSQDQDLPPLIVEELLAAPEEAPLH